VKNTRFGESYNRDGVPQSVKTSPEPTQEETRTKGVIPELEIRSFGGKSSQPGNVLRVFERGGPQESGKSAIPIVKKDAGKPDDKLSERGFGTGLRTDPVFLGLPENALA